MLTTVVASGLRRGVVMVVGRAMGAKVGPTKLPEVMKPERLVLPADYKWKVFAATALERIPPYPPVIPEWEADFERVRDYVEDVNHPRFASEEDVEKAYAKLLGVEPKKIKVSSFSFILLFLLPPPSSPSSSSIRIDPYYKDTPFSFSYLLLLLL